MKKIVFFFLACLSTNVVLANLDSIPVLSGSFFSIDKYVYTKFNEEKIREMYGVDPIKIQTVDWNGLVLAKKFIFSTNGNIQRREYKFTNTERYLNGSQSEMKGSFGKKTNYWSEFFGLYNLYSSSNFKFGVGLSSINTKFTYLNPKETITPTSSSLEWEAVVDKHHDIYPLLGFGYTGKISQRISFQSFCSIYLLKGENWNDIVSLPYFLVKYTGKKNTYYAIEVGNNSAVTGIIGWKNSALRISLTDLVRNTSKNRDDTEPPLRQLRCGIEKRF